MNFIQAQQQAMQQRQQLMMAKQSGIQAARMQNTTIEEITKVQTHVSRQGFKVMAIVLFLFLMFAYYRIFKPSGNQRLFWVILGIFSIAAAYEYFKLLRSDGALAVATMI